MIPYNVSCTVAVGIVLIGVKLFFESKNEKERASRLKIIAYSFMTNMLFMEGGHN